jgi:hypothetical protein
MVVPVADAARIADAQQPVEGCDLPARQPQQQSLEDLGGDEGVGEGVVLAAAGDAERLRQLRQPRVPQARQPGAAVVRRAAREPVVERPRVERAVREGGEAGRGSARRPIAASRS